MDRAFAVLNSECKYGHWNKFDITPSSLEEVREMHEEFRETTYSHCMSQNNAQHALYLGGFIMLPTNTHVLNTSLSGFELLKNLIFHVDRLVYIILCGFCNSSNLTDKKHLIGRTSPFWCFGGKHPLNGFNI